MTRRVIKSISIKKLAIKVVKMKKCKNRTFLYCLKNANVKYWLFIRKYVNLQLNTAEYPLFEFNDLNNRLR